MRISDWSSDVCSSDLDPGEIVDDRGRVIGQHQGLMYYTLGQRRGLGIGGVRDARDAPWFVIAKDAARNRLIAAQDSEHARLMTREIVTRDRKSTSLNSSHYCASRMTSSACKKTNKHN